MTQTIVAIDDEPGSLMLLEAYLQGAGHAVRVFDGARPALDYLRAGQPADAILLDRLMPGMDGLDFMPALRALPGRTKLPVILQTAATTATQVAEGIRAGAYYYLTKPYSRELLLAVLSRALADAAFHADLARDAGDRCEALAGVDQFRLSFRTLAEVRQVSCFLSTLFPDPEAVILGITELMLNAVEHGNLGISYAEKGALTDAVLWRAELDRRLALPENGGKQAWVTFERTSDCLGLTIEDMGPGFDWTRYTCFDFERVADSHGRGIAMSRLVSFDDVTYVSPGNKVLCRKFL